MKKNLLIGGVLAIGLLLTGCNSKVKDAKAVEITSGVVTQDIRIGEKLKDIEIKDQFDKKHKILPTTKKIIIVCKKSTGHLVKEYLNKKPLDYLAKRNIQFIADVSKMPSFIYKMVALPDLQEHKYPIMVILDEKIGAKYKNEQYQEMVMVVHIDNLTVKNVKFIANEKDLIKEID